MIDLEQLAKILDDSNFSESYIGYKANHEAVYLLFNEKLSEEDKKLLAWTSQILKYFNPSSSYAIIDRSTDQEHIDVKTFGIVEKEKGKLGLMMPDSKYYWVQFKIK